MSVYYMYMYISLKTQQNNRAPFSFFCFFQTMFLPTNVHMHKLNWCSHNNHFWFFFYKINIGGKTIAYLANPDIGNLVKIHRTYLIPGGDFFVEEFWMIQNVLKLPITKLAVTVMDIVKLNSWYISLSKYALAKTRSQSNDIKKNSMDIRATRHRHLKSKMSSMFPSFCCFSSDSSNWTRSISSILCSLLQFQEQNLRSVANYVLNWTVLHTIKQVYAVTTCIFLLTNYVRFIKAQQFLIDIRDSWSTAHQVKLKL